MLELLPKLPAGCEFHHVGYATASLDQEDAFFALLGYCREGEGFADPEQGVAGRFIIGPGPRIELLENLPGANTLTPWLNAGIKMYHLAYLVDDLGLVLDWARSQRAKVTVAAVPAVAFGGRHISFVVFRNGLMLELIEKSPRIAVTKEGI